LESTRATAILLFGTGSPLLADVEESLVRAGIEVLAGIPNRPGPSYLSEDTRSVPLSELPPENLELPFLVPIFTPAYRREAALEAAVLGLHRPYRLIDPSVPVPGRLEFGAGCYVNAGCTLGSRCVFGSFVLVNRGASIGHHVSLGAFVSIGPGVVIAGQVTIGVGSVVGAGATILPGLTIGENSVVGAGSVVTRDVPAGCLVTGNAARVVRRDIGGYKGLSVA
jgi:sugar O-acyltransferase (sialic acid O-acetyltransferase NeuD family)